MARPSTTTTTLTHLLSLLLLLSSFPSSSLAQSVSTTSTTSSSPTASPTIVHSIPNSKYVYLGCYNETTSVEGTGGARALDGGINEVKDGAMTVDMCLSFCGGGGSSTQYRYAGLEFSRECWCAQHISGASARLDDGECDTTCDGNGTTVCGGSLKISVYEVSSSAAIRITYMTAVIALAGTILFHLFF
ncbi:WSC domain-containing protein [Coniochaeta sp. 2T2.1]|nr:WSC domain-containing protein [Coniochaeta sp. 2T2.1]